MSDSRQPIAPAEMLIGSGNSRRCRMRQSVVVLTPSRWASSRGRRIVESVVVVGVACMRTLSHAPWLTIRRMFSQILYFRPSFAKRPLMVLSFAFSRRAM
jgi:hypothetical protein